MSRGIAAWKNKIMLWEMKKNVTSKKKKKKRRNVNKLKVSWRKFLTRKNPHSSNYALLTKVHYELELLQTFIRTILVTCNGHRLFLHFNCLKSWRSTYLLSYHHMLTTLVDDYPWLPEKSALNKFQFVTF